jgi:hypothetical protein
MTIITLHRKTNAPTRRLVFTGFDFTGSSVLIEMKPDNGPAVTVSTTTGELVLDGTDAVIWTYTEAFVAALPLGQRTKWDLYRTIAGKTDKLDAGEVKVLGPGEVDDGGDVVVQVPGPQGPAFAVPRGAWSAGTYEATSFVTDNGSSWWTEVDTSGEPGISADWQLWLDGSGAAADRDAAATSASAAGNAAGVATAAAGAAVGAAEMTAQDRVATGDDRVATGQDRAAVATDRGTVTADKATVQGIYDAVTAAPDTISAATYTLVSGDLGKTKRFTAACVVTLPATLPAGWYCVLRRIGIGAVTWVVGGSATKHEYPPGAGIAAQWASVAVSVDSNAGSAAVWIVEGSVA